MARQERNWRIARDVVQKRLSRLFSETLPPEVRRKSPVLRTKNIGFTNDRGLHDDNVVYVANPVSATRGFGTTIFGGLAQETDVIVDAFF